MRILRLDRPVAAAQSSRPRPRLFRALGRLEPPERIQIESLSYRRFETFKHDSWAATALYEGPPGRVVCKFNRTQPILGIPMRWLGRALARREARLLARLQGIAGIPVVCGPICESGAVLPNAVAHSFVPGHPLGKREEVLPGFMPRLRKLVQAIHARNVACVDLHKRENILVGDDGLPYFIDLQIGFDLPARGLGWLGLGRLILRLLQRSDVYHVAKHIRRHDPRALLPDERALTEHRPWWIRAHRLVARPFRALRRRLLVLLGIRRDRGRAESERAPEIAVRLEHAAYDRRSTSHVSSNRSRAAQRQSTASS